MKVYMKDGIIINLEKVHGIFASGNEIKFFDDSTGDNYWTIKFDSKEEAIEELKVIKEIMEK